MVCSVGNTTDKSLFSLSIDLPVPGQGVDLRQECCLVTPPAAHMSLNRPRLNTLDLTYPGLNRIAQCLTYHFHKLSSASVTPYDAHYGFKFQLHPKIAISMLVLYYL